MLDLNNLAKTWKAWKEEFQLYIDLTLTEALEGTMVKLFYYLVGETSRELCENVLGSSTADRTVQQLLDAFDQHCNPKQNETVETYRFFMRNHGTDEGFDKYVTELKMLASTCHFGDIKDSLKAHTHRDEYRRTLFASVFQRVCCVHTQAIFDDDEPSEHANSFPDIRWRLM